MNLHRSTRSASPAVARLVRAAALVLALFAPMWPCQAQQPYPAKPVHLILGLPAGGGADVIARLVAQELSQTLGQPVLVENRPGASGVIAADAVAKAPADGYTLLFGGSSLVLAPAFGKPLPHDPVADFAPISRVASVPTVLVAGSQMPFRSVPELVAYARSHPGEVNYASSGNGSSLHLFMEMFKLQTGMQATHVPYKGGVQASPDLIKGRIHTMFEILPTQIANIQAGKVRALAITSERRNDQVPDVPTMREAGLPDFEAGIWYGLYAPAHTPASIQQTLHGAITRALASSSLQQRLKQLGAEATPSSAAELARWQRLELERWTQVIRSSGATSE
jgi:tripartite-type tricarboxylate transporter receptor subunit TctC